MAIVSGVIVWKNLDIYMRFDLTCSYSSASMDKLRRDHLNLRWSLGPWHGRILVEPTFQCQGAIFFWMVETSNWGLRQGWTGRGWKSAWRGKKAGKSTDPNIWQKVCKLLLRYLFCIMMFWWRKTLNPLTWIWQLLQLVLSSSPTFHLGGEEEGGQLHFPRLIISFLLSPPAPHSLSYL